MKYLFSLILLLLFSFSPLSASDTNMFEAVVKVHHSVGGGMDDYGTGTCINLDDNYIYILTNKHVVGQDKEVNVQFYRKGHESVDISAEVCWTAYRQNEPVDIAVLKVDRKKINWTPTIVKCQLDDKVYSKGQAVITIGCPEAGWPRAYKGHIVKENGGVYWITPSVEPGQSGSILLNEDGTKAIGLIAWSNNGYGKAMTLKTIRQATLGKLTTYTFHQPYNIENSENIPVDYVVRGRLHQGGGCGPGGCNPQGGGDSPCGPNGCRPRRNDDKPTENTPNPNTDGGLKIFPTFPGDTDTPEEKKPDDKPKVVDPPKVDAKFDNLEKRVNDLTDAFGVAKKQFESDHGKLVQQVTDLDIKTGKIDTASLAKQIADIETKLGNKANSGDVVTPGNLERQLIAVKDAITPGKLNDLLKLAPVITELKGTQQTLVKTDDLNRVTDGLNTVINGVKDQVNKRVDSSVSDQTKSIVSVFEKIIASTNNKDATAGNNIVNSYGSTALVTLIPTIGALLLGWMFKNKVGSNSGNNAIIIAQAVANEIKNHLGGVVPQAPFPKNPTTVTPIAGK